MNVMLDHSRLVMPRGQTISVNDAQNACIRCIRGSLWVTFHHDTRDFILSPGEELLLAKPGPVLISAWSDSDLVLRRGAEPPAARSTGSRLAAAARTIVQAATAIWDPARSNESQAAHHLSRTREAQF